MNTCDKKVLFVANTCTFISNFLIPYVDLFHKWGYAVHAAAPADARKQRIEAIFDNVLDIPIHRSPFSYHNIIALAKLINVMKKEHYSLVHVHTPMGSVVGRFAALATKTAPVFYTAHGFHFYDGASIKNWILYYPMERFLSRYTDVLITINQEDYMRSRQFRLRSKKAPLYLPGIGVDLKKFRADILNNDDNTQEEKESKVPRILFIGELTPNKNQVQLLRAVPALLKQFPNLQVLFAGEGKNLSHLVEIAQSLHISHSVKWLGFRMDIPDLLRRSSLTVLTSLREGLPVCLLESMAAGKPVIGTNIRGIRDLIEDGINGYLVPPGDIQATVRACAAILSNPELAAEMGKRNREKAEQYSVDRIIEKISDIYLQHLEKNE